MGVSHWAKPKDLREAPDWSVMSTHGHDESLERLERRQVRPLWSTAWVTLCYLYGQSRQRGAQRQGQRHVDAQGHRALTTRAPHTERMGTYAEVTRTGEDVRFIVHIGDEQTIYKFTGHQAKQFGEALFREGCDLIATQPQEEET